MPLSQSGVILPGCRRSVNLWLQGDELIKEKVLCSDMFIVYICRQVLYRIHDILVKDTSVMDISVTDISVTGHFGNRTFQ